MKFRYSIVFALLVSTVGCVQMRGIGGGGVLAIDRQVTPITGEKTVTFIEPVVRGDGGLGETKTIIFPAGIYTLEAEDSDYFYFRAPAPLEYRVIEGAKLENGNLTGKVTDGRAMPGGLALVKSLWRGQPAKAYLSVSATNKTWTMGFGLDFMSLEPEKWKRNY